MNFINKLVNSKMELIDYVINVERYIQMKISSSKQLILVYTAIKEMEVLVKTIKLINEAMYKKFILMKLIYLIK